MSERVAARVYSIPNDQLGNAEELALATMHMSREKAQESFSEAYERTYAECLDAFDCRGMFAAFPIEGIDGGGIRLEGGAILKSQMLADLLHRADEVMFYAVCTHGYESVIADSDDIIDDMLYNAWGGGFTMAAHRWIKREIADYARESNRHVGRGWVPGEGGLEMDLQKTLLEQIDSTQIGMTVSDHLATRPVMSVCGIMGVSDDEAIENDGSDIVQYH